MDNSLKTTIANPVRQLPSNCRNYAMSLNWFGGDGRRCPEGSGADIPLIECLLYIDSIRSLKLQTPKLKQSPTQAISESSILPLENVKHGSISSSNLGYSNFLAFFSL
jgi:hypothetical protein